MGKIPVTLVTGFLGSGKTTLLNHILKAYHGKKIAVIENDYSEIGIDDQLIHQELLPHKNNFVFITNGCICCSSRGDLVKNLHHLLLTGTPLPKDHQNHHQNHNCPTPHVDSTTPCQCPPDTTTTTTTDTSTTSTSSSSSTTSTTETDSRPFDCLVIETSGLADPSPVAQLFFVDPIIESRAYLDGVVAVVDAQHILQHLDESKSHGAENEPANQIAFADRILVNKIDLVEPSYLHNQVLPRIQSINSFSSVILTQHAAIDPNLILSIGAFDLKRLLVSDPHFLNPSSSNHTHDPSVSSVGFHFRGQISLPMLQTLIQELIRQKGADLFRYKGVLALKGIPRRLIFQGVHALFSSVYGEPWDDIPEEERECKFCFIGKNLNRQALTENFMKCIVTRELRFPIGSMVFAYTDRGWRPGQILACWEQGNAYRIAAQLNPNSAELIEMYAPIDEDRFVRSPSS